MIDSPEDKNEHENQNYAIQLEKFQRRLPNLPILYNWTHFKCRKNENLETWNGCTKHPQIISIQEHFIINWSHKNFL